MSHDDDELQLDILELLDATPTGGETEWAKQAKAVLIPTPGYERSYTEMQAELEAAGVPVPPGLKLLALREQSAEGLLGDGPFRPRLND